MPTLKQTLAIDAVGAVLSVIVLVGFADAIARATGLPGQVVEIAGWICLPSALLFAHQAVRPSPSLLRLVVAGNTAWVISSAAVWIAYLDRLTPLGHAIVIAQAVAVEALAILEWRGLKSLAARPAAA